MPTATDLYVPRNPGDLVTAEDWNDLQKRIKDDIDAKVKAALAGVPDVRVKNAESSDKLQDKTPEQLAKEIVDKALAELTKATGYRNYFKVLPFDKDIPPLEHGLKAFPLVDIYQLDYFPVVCAEDEQKSLMWVNFYLYHSSEKTLRLTPGAASQAVEIQPTKEPYFRIPFLEMLERYGIRLDKLDKSCSLDELETMFWEAFFTKPNDPFGDDQYCHSPWFDRCCGDRRSVDDMMKAGNLKDLWFKMVPRKTINYPRPPSTAATTPATVTASPSAAPTQIQVVHYDFNTLGLKLLERPEPQVVPQGTPGDVIEMLRKPELKVMVLLNAGAGVKIESPTTAS